MLGSNRKRLGGGRMTIEDRKPGLLSRIALKALVAFYHRQGWRAETAGPIPRKCVLIAAPHTSNWDFLYFVGHNNNIFFY